MKQPTPPQTSGKAVAAGIASLVTSLVLAFAGVMPSTEELIAADVEALLRELVTLAAAAIVPAVAAYYKRNYLK